MNKFKLFAIALFFVGIAAYAQDFAHVNGSEIINSMPETKSADEEIKKIVANHQAEVKKQENALVQLQKDAETFAKSAPQDPSKWTQEQKAKIQTFQTDYQEKTKRLGEYQQTAAEDISKTRTRLLEPIEKKAQDAINSVAAKKNIKYVFDISQGGLVYYNGGINITTDVKKELGIQ